MLSARWVYIETVGSISAEPRTDGSSTAILSAADLVYSLQTSPRALSPPPKEE